MIRARSISLVLAIMLAPALSSCASRSIPPLTQTPAVAQNAAPTPLKKATLSGLWKGSWHSNSDTGGFKMQLTQKAKTFSGKVLIAISAKQLIEATIKGTIKHKGKITLAVSATPLGTGKGTAQTNKTRTTMKGSLTFTKFGKIQFSATKG